MKKKILITVFAMLFLFIMAGWYSVFFYLGQGPTPPLLKSGRVEYDSVNDFVAEDAPLMAIVASEEEACEIAEKYKIELVFSEDGVALFRTEEDLYAVIRRGEENGYPPLWVNYVRTIDQ